MFRVQAPMLIVPTAEAREALGVQLRPAALAAYREIALAAKGLEIAHLQFSFGKLTLAICSRVRSRSPPNSPSASSSSIRTARTTTPIG